MDIEEDAASEVAAPAASEAAGPAVGQGSVGVGDLQHLMVLLWPHLPDRLLQEHSLLSRRGCIPPGDSRGGRIPHKQSR